jgi:hypothetical protein
MNAGAFDTADLTAAFAKRIRGAAREHRRDRLVIEMACIDWELSHFDAHSRATIETLLAETFSAPAFARLLEQSVLGRNGNEWKPLFEALGL